jgi:hypothetical protein
VTSIPSGTAKGSSESGEVIIERQVMSCDGTCSVLSNGRMVTFCVVGAAMQDPAKVEQVDGSLKVSFERQAAANGIYAGWDLTNELPIMLAGGLNADQSFDVGGYVDEFRGTQQPDWPDVYARVQGTFAGDGLTADLQTRRTMTILDDNGVLTRIDCKAHETFTGSRVAGP